MSLFKKNRNTKSSGRGKKVLIVAGCMLAFMALAPAANNQTVDGIMGVETSYAAEATFSQYWQQDSNGAWHVYDSSGQMIKNAWLCDDAVTANGKDIWYLLDENGSMITNGLVQDGTGNYYSLETNHNGFFGMLRYKSGTYDNVYLDLESSHTCGFAKIKNTDGIDALNAKCSVRSVSISNENCVYTSTFKTGGSGTGGTQAPAGNGGARNGGQNNGGNGGVANLIPEDAEGGYTSGDDWDHAFVG